MLSDEQASAIRARVEKATPGPWEYDGMHSEIVTPRGAEYWLIVSECRSAPDQSYECDEFGHQFDANLDFIAHAREDIPALLADRDELRRQLAESRAREAQLRAAIESIRDDCRTSLMPDALGEDTEGWLRRKVERCAYRADAALVTPSPAADAVRKGVVSLLATVAALNRAICCNGVGPRTPTGRLCRAAIADAEQSIAALREAGLMPREEGGA